MSWRQPAPPLRFAMTDCILNRMVAIPDSPVKMKKKGRGAAAAKLKATIPQAPLTNTYDDTFIEIETLLMKHHVGTFRVYATDMTFKWTDGKNRALDTSVKSKGLQESMEAGVWRTEPKHRLTGIVERKDLKGNLHNVPGSNHPPKKIDLKDVPNLNKEGVYPVVRFMKDSGWKVEMQSGQHRMHILQRLTSQTEEHWWLVTIYDKGSSELSTR